MNPLLVLLGVAAFSFAALRRKSPAEPTVVEPEHVSAPNDAPLRRVPQLLDPSKLRRGVDPVREALRLTNAFRARGGSCGGVAMPPVAALAWDDRLARSALAHAQDMASKGYFAHVSPSGSRPEQRMAAAGWTSRPVGENIAAGQATADEVVKGWIDSPGHCKNLLNGNYKYIGIALFNAPGTQYQYYWVQNFGG